MAAPYLVKPFERKESLELALLEFLERLFQDAEADHPYAVMLSGGSTPKALYRRIAESGIRAGAGLHLLVSDERIVPEGSPEANSTLVRPMAEAIGLPAERIHMVEHNRTAAKAAETYDETLTALNRLGVSRSLALLGIGGDGHTASIFEAEEAQRPHTSLAIPVDYHAGFERVTTTPEEILSYRQIVFFATGTEKREILDAISAEPERFPAGIIAGRHRSAELWTDNRPDEAKGERT